MTARSLTTHNNPNAPAESFDVRAPRRQEADAFPVQPYSALVILGVWVIGAALPLAIVFKLAGVLQTLALLFLLTGLVTYVTSPRREY
jgi:hypothetical protein